MRLLFSVSGSFSAYFLGHTSPDGPAGLEEATGDDGYENGCGAKNHGDY